MLLLIASISSPEERELMTVFYETKLKLLYHEAQKYISNKETIEDIVYEAFKILIEKIDVFKSLHPKQQDRYAVVIVRNLCFLHLRDEKHFSTVPFEETLKIADTTPDHNPEMFIEQQVDTQQIYSIISQLKTPERLLLEQKFILKWSEEQMAQFYEIKISNLRMRLTRAKHSLLKLMQEQNFQPPLCLEQENSTLTS